MYIKVRFTAIIYRECHDRQHMVVGFMPMQLMYITSSLEHFFQV